MDVFGEQAEEPEGNVLVESDDTKLARLGRRPRCPGRILSLFHRERRRCYERLWKWKVR